MQQDWDTMIADAATAVGVSPSLYKNVIYNGENFGSGSVNTGTSKAGATGPGQVMPATFAALKKQGRLPPNADITNPADNLKAGAMVLKEGVDLNGGNEAAGVAHYNGGTKAGKAVAAGEPPPNAEVANYLRRTGMADDTIDTASTLGSSSNSTRTNTGTRTSSKTFDANFDPADIVNTWDANLQGLMQPIVSAIALNSKYTDSAATNLMAEASATEKSANTQAEIDAQRQEQQNHQAMLFGISGDDVTKNRVLAAHAKRQQAQDVMDQLQPKIDAEDAIMPWDDPLRWVVNQFTLPALKSTYNAAHHVDTEMTRRIANDEATVQAQQLLDTAPVADMLRQKGAATGAAASFGLQAQANQLRAQSASVLAQGAMQALAVGTQDMQSHLQVVKLLQEVTTTNAYTSQMTAATEKERKALVDEAPTLAKWNMKLQALGKTAMDAGAYHALPAKEKADITNRVGYASFGSDVADSYELIHSLGAAQSLQDVNPPVYKFYNDVISSKAFNDEKALVQGDVMGAAQKYAKLDLVGQQAMVLERMQDKWLKETQGQANMDKLQGDLIGPALTAKNPYILDKNAASLYPELKDNIFNQTVIARKLTDSRYNAKDSDLLMEAIGRATANPAKIPELATQLSDYYRTATAKQYSLGAAQAGLPRPRGYAVGVQGNYVDQTGTPRALQMYNAPEIENFLMQQRAQGARSDFVKANTPLTGIGASRLDSPFGMN